ncbi:MAG TPA: MFS transporter [Actinocatenispora sp.]
MAVAARAGFGRAFEVPSFRALWTATVQSQFGNQLARLALAVLVFDRTSSPVLTALTYALTFLPPMVAAPLLTGLADRHSRRTVLVAADLVRAALIGLTALPGLPLPAVGVLVTLTACVHPLYSSASGAALPALLPGDRYPVGAGVLAMTDMVTQIAGFGLGGVALDWLGGPRGFLALDAATFALSALLLRTGLPPLRPAPPESPGVETARGGQWAALRMVLTDRRLAVPAGMVWLYGLFLAPEALAVPFTHQIGAGAGATGWLMAADPVGALVGTLLLTRVVPQRWWPALLAPLVVATGVPLVLSALAPTLPVALVLWPLTGVLTCYITIAQVTYVRRVPDDRRGRAAGVASAGLQTAQGVGVLLAGALAELMAPSTAIGVCAAAGVLLAVVLATALPRDAARRDGTPVAGFGEPTASDDGAVTKPR